MFSLDCCSLHCSHLLVPSYCSQSAIFLLLHFYFHFNWVLQTCLSFILTVDFKFVFCFLIWKKTLIYCKNVHGMLAKCVHDFITENSGRRGDKYFYSMNVFFVLFANIKKWHISIKLLYIYLDTLLLFLLYGSSACLLILIIFNVRFILMLLTYAHHIVYLEKLLLNLKFCK